MHYRVKFRFLGGDADHYAGPFTDRQGAEVFVNAWTGGRENGRRATVEPVDVVDIESDTDETWVKTWTHGKGREYR